MDKIQTKKVYKEMNIESLLISSIISNKDIKSVVDYKITLDFFHSPINKQTYKFILDHYQKYNKIPSKSLVKNSTGFKKISVKDSIKFYIDKLIEKEKRFRTKRILSLSANELKDKNTDKSINILSEGIMDLLTNVDPSKDAFLYSAKAKIYSNYLMRAKFSGLDGYTYGLSLFDDVTGGMHNGELITLLGRPKMGKTFGLLLVVDANAMLNKKCLVISQEMSRDQMLNRLVSIKFNLPYREFRLGKLSLKQRQHFYKGLKALKHNDYPVVISADESDDTYKDGILMVKAKIQQYKPDICFIDGHYLLVTEKKYQNQHEAAKELVRKTKRLARTENIPIFVTSQFNRQRNTGGKSMDTAAFTDAYIQDSDVIMEVERSKLMDAQKECVYKIVGQREGETISVLRAWDFETMNFEEKGICEDEE